ncbi:MAG: RDD family protein [Bryobacteraceae bacterium]
MQWYYADNGQQHGPVDDDALASLVVSGVVRDETLVWREGMPNWQPYSSMRVGASVAAGPAPGLAVHAAAPGGYVPENYAARPQTVRYAGFWIRFLARLIDGVLLQIALLVVRVPLGLSVMGPMTTRDPAAMMALAGAMIVGSLVSLAIASGYEIFFVSARGATLGKMALGLKVVRPDGAPISISQSAGRYLAQILSAVILCIGYIMAGFDDQKRSLHDRLAGTRVIRLR